MLLYLSSQKFGNKTNLLKNWIKEHDNKILLVFNAMDAKGAEKVENNIKEDRKLLEEIGFEVTILDLKEYFDNKEKLKEKFMKYNACCIMGGNVFVLRQAMKYSGLDKLLQEKLTNEDFLYIGYSAGSCVTGKNLKIFEQVDEPKKYYNKNHIFTEGLDFIDYIFIPHYKSDYHKVHLIEEIVKKCKRQNKKYKSVRDGEVIIENIRG